MGSWAWAAVAVATAMAAAAGLTITWDDFTELSAVTPSLTRIYPNGIWNLHIPDDPIRLSFNPCSHFAPEFLRRIKLQDAMKAKKLREALKQAETALADSKQREEVKREGERLASKWRDKRGGSSNELESAYDDAGVGENPRENDGMAAIYYYIDQEVRSHYEDNKDDWYDEWKLAQPEEEPEEETANA